MNWFKEKIKDYKFKRDNKRFHEGYNYALIECVKNGETTENLRRESMFENDKSFANGMKEAVIFCEILELDENHLKYKPESFIIFPSADKCPQCKEVEN